MGKNSIPRRPKLTTEEFIKRAKSIHGKRYDYGETVYDGLHRKVNIRCPKHDIIFDLLASSHLSKKQRTGCPLCGKERMRARFADTKEQFITKAIAIHGDLYDYSKIEYVNNSTKIFIICKRHNEGWWTRPGNHTHGRRGKEGPGFGNGCPLCAQDSRNEKSTKTNEQFILEARKIWGNRYDYSRVNYRGAHRKVEIVCPAHGSFFLNPAVHIFQDTGCTSCSPKSKGEERIKEVLEMIGIWYSREVSFPDCISPTGGILKYDFAIWLEGLTVLIEYDGQQHYQVISRFGGEERHQASRIRDEVKNDYAQKDGIELIRIPYWDYEKIPHIILSEFNDHWKPIAKYRHKARVVAMPSIPDICYTQLFLDI